MLYKTHIVGGLALGYIMFNKLPILNLNVDMGQSKTLLIVTSGLILGSLFPDIDHKNSYISRKIKPLSNITSKIFRHREFTHSIIGTIFISYLMYFILGRFKIDSQYVNMFTIAFTIGLISHILLDIITISGVVLFYPIYKKRIRIGLFKSNNYSKMDYKEMIFVLILLIITFLSYSNFI